MSEGGRATSVRRIIVGPTAAGKSAIAMHLAERYDLTIVSADSRQIYRGFDIGTAKPSAVERSRVPHLGIDILSPLDRYSAHQWARDVIGWEAESRGGGREPIIVGGTGFYIRALVSPLDIVPTLDPARRAELETYLSTLSANEIERWCQRLDPVRASLGRTQRLRAIETALLSGTRLSDALTADAEQTGANETARPVVRYLVVDPGPILATWVEARVQAMVAAGWLDEIRALEPQVPVSAPAWNASGYGTMRQAVQGKISPDEAIARVVIETRQYAKRQRTWFRNQLSAAQVTSLDSSAPDALDRARVWWESAEGSLV